MTENLESLVVKRYGTFEITSGSAIMIDPCYTEKPSFDFYSIFEPYLFLAPDVLQGEFGIYFSTIYGDGTYEITRKGNNLLIWIYKDPVGKKVGECDVDTGTLMFSDLEKVTVKPTVRRESYTVVELPKGIYVVRFGKENKVIISPHYRRSHLNDKGVSLESKRKEWDEKGFKVLRLWEHEIKEITKTLRRARFLEAEIEKLEKKLGIK